MKKPDPRDLALGMMIAGAMLFGLGFALWILKHFPI